MYEITVYSGFLAVMSGFPHYPLTSVHYKSLQITTCCRPLSSSYSTVQAEEHFITPATSRNPPTSMALTEHQTHENRGEEKDEGARDEEEEVEEERRAGGLRNGLCL